MQDLKIDLVYLWVNDKDEEWQAKRKYWVNKLGITTEEENNNCRFSDNDELKYSLRSVQMYAPWINKIFIVTDRQVPNWLDTKNSKIKIIDHNDIMPSDSLPCFNSAAIESCLDNILELSEYFLYANDDMFFASKVTPNDFFDENNNPIVNLRSRKWTEPNNLYTQRILYTQDLFNKAFNKKADLFMADPSHCIDAYRKSYFSSCKEFFRQEFNKLLYQKFRTPNTIQRIIFSLFMLENKQASLKSNPPIAEQDFYTNLDNLYLKLESKYSLENVIKKHAPKLLCINDTQDTDDKARRSLKAVLANLFPQKQAWEIVKEFSIEPVFEDNYYSIVFSFDNKYCRYFAPLLQSLIEYSNGEKFDIIVFNSDITTNNHKLLQSMLPENFSLRFFDISDFISANFSSIKLKSVHNWSVEIYNRIFIPLLMPLYKKVLYLDTDVIINNSLKELFNIDFENKQILAVKDATAQILHLKEFEERYKHIKHCLNLKNETNYFNSGMLMFNIPSIDKSEYKQLVEKAFEQEKLLYPDQDILNVIFENKVKFVSTKWNFCCGIFIWNKDFLCYLRDNYLSDVKSALQNPCIIHYTSPQKPWNSELELFYELFWKYAKQTVFYEDILFARSRELTLKTIIEGAKFTNLYLQIQSGKKIVFWGASLFLEEFCQKYNIQNSNIIGVIDKNPSKQGKFLGQYKIFAPKDLSWLKPDEIIITIVNSARERAIEVKDFLKNSNFIDIEVKTI